MCYYETKPKKDIENINDEVEQIKEIYNSLKMNKNYFPTNITFNSHGEPFLYLEAYKEVYKTIKEFEDEKNIKIHKRIYTSGALMKESD